MTDLPTPGGEGAGERHPELTISWTSAGSYEQDEALCDEIIDYAMPFLDGYSPSAWGNLDPATTRTSPQLSEGMVERAARAITGVLQGPQNVDRVWRMYEDVARAALTEALADQGNE